METWKKIRTIVLQALLVLGLIVLVVTGIWLVVRLVLKTSLPTLSPQPSPEGKEISTTNPSVAQDSKDGISLQAALEAILTVGKTPVAGKTP